jgi:excisionase family DNA binding protein
MPEAEPLLTPAEVATMFRVDPKTVTRWAKQGKLTWIMTLGGHRRYREAEVRGLLAGIPNPQQDTGRCPQCTYMYTSPAHRNSCAGKS